MGVSRDSSMPCYRGNPIRGSAGTRESADPAAEPLDPDVMRAVAGGDPLVIREMVQDFILAALADIAEIRAAVDGERSDRVRSASHKLKGSSGLVGARRLVEVCRQLEAAGDLGNWQRITELIPELERLMREIETAADAYLRRTDLPATR